MAKPSISIPIWIKLAVILAAILFAAGGILALANPAMLVTPHATIGQSARIYAGYFASRNLVIAALLLATLLLRQKQALSGLMLLATLIQFADACIDAVEGRWPIVPGVLLLGALFAIVAARLSAPPLWTQGTWSSADASRASDAE